MNNFEIAINGVRLASNLLGIKPPEVTCFIDDNLNCKGINSMFLKDAYEISFSSEWIEMSTWLEILAACFHEARHAFQYVFIRAEYNGKEKISDEEIKVWKQEISSYEQPSGILENDEFYLNQEIEIDAIAYAHYQMYKQFKVKTVIPISILCKVKSRLTLFV
ncbi:hypothetical protein RJI07_04020 [Mycoplasmatota bacterium WC30]